MRFVFLLFLLLGSTLLTKAQGLPGYILSLSGDTLRGTILEQPALRQIKLYASDSRKAQIFGPEQIKGYGLGTSPIVRSAVVRRAGTSRTEMQFVVAKQLGTASIFQFSNGMGLLLQPPATDTLYELSAENWHILYIRHLTECASSHLTEARFLALSFNDSYALQELANYNRCIDPNWKNQEHLKPHVWSSSLGVQTGYGNTTTNVEGGYRSRGSQQQLGLQWQLLRASGSQLSFAVGYMRLKQQTNFYQTFSPDGNPSNDEQAHFQNQYLTGELRIGRRIGRFHRPNLLVSLGVGSEYMIARRVEYYQRQSSTATTLNRIDTNNEGGITAHFSGALGASIPLTNRQELQVAAQYQQRIVYGVNGLSFQLAYLFRTR